MAKGSKLYSKGSKLPNPERLMNMPTVEFRAFLASMKAHGGVSRREINQMRHWRRKKRQCLAAKRMRDRHKWVGGADDRFSKMIAYMRTNPKMCTPDPYRTIAETDVDLFDCIHPSVNGKNE